MEGSETKSLNSLAAFHWKQPWNSNFHWRVERVLKENQWIFSRSSGWLNGLLRIGWKQGVWTGVERKRLEGLTREFGKAGRFSLRKLQLFEFSINRVRTNELWRRAFLQLLQKAIVWRREKLLETELRSCYSWKPSSFSSITLPTIQSQEGKFKQGVSSQLVEHNSFQRRFQFKKTPGTEETNLHKLYKHWLKNKNF